MFLNLCHQWSNGSINFYSNTPNEKSKACKRTNRAVNSVKRFIWLRVSTLNVTLIDNMNKKVVIYSSMGFCAEADIWSEHVALWGSKELSMRLGKNPERREKMTCDVDFLCLCWLIYWSYILQITFRKTQLLKSLEFYPIKHAFGIEKIGWEDLWQMLVFQFRLKTFQISIASYFWVESERKGIFFCFFPEKIVKVFCLH